jgi:hypothetical protein
MTAKKSLKKHVRERQAKTGERYMTALAQVRAKVAHEGHRDVSPWAEAEALQCQATSSEALWRAECSLGAPEERFRSIFARLRGLLLSLSDAERVKPLRAAVLSGAPWVAPIPNAVREVAEAWLFRAQVQAGVRGLSPNGRLVALDVPRGATQVTVLGVFVPVPGADRRPLLWLKELDEGGSASEVGAMLEPSLMLAGLGGLSG